MTDVELTVPDSGLMIPKHLEKVYNLIELISERAGMWTLQVKRRSDGQMCVAKVFSGSHRQSGKREADILGSLDHPEIPALKTFPH